MTKLALAAAVLALAACQSAYHERTTDTISARPPVNPTGSAGYPLPGPGGPATLDSTAPANPTGSAGYQGYAPGSSDRITGAPPANPTGSAHYQY